MSTRDLACLHKLSGWHETAILSSNRCGCFYCLSIFAPDDIEEWVDEPPNCPRGAGRTALCPACGIDAVLPDLPEVGLHVELLRMMQVQFF